MRFLHTADWHLGKLLHGVHLTDDQRYLVDQIVEIADDADPDAVVIAGDVYDRSVPPADAIELLDDALTRLVVDIGVPVIAIGGNHDSAERLDFGSSILERQGLHVFSRLRKKPGHVVLEDEHGPVHFLAFPFAEPAMARSVFGKSDIRSHDEVLAAQVESASDLLPDGERAVAIAHVFAQGGDLADSERTLSIGGAETVHISRFQRFCYTALGHLHRRQHIGASNGEAPRHVRYSGSLMKYSFNETGHDKSVHIVDVDGDGTCEIETIPLELRRDLCRIEGTMTEILDGPADHVDPDDYIWVTLTDDGPVHDAMSRIREVYPNALHIERPRRVETNKLQQMTGDASSLSVDEVFETFFTYVTGRDDMPEQQRDILHDALERKHKES
ncbi:exonuclease sbcCD subunit D [Longibacter salinarum]|uniref:Nuclease SbcCD subunit D n=1 Tax=Longibacter salinarum TaxID=1850348 RepID=A0A2A8D0A9_9BACT|nr:exonuclease SbcCD subunit D [Longibacter salinarum]PEN14273.1 exonuclease sbcCD subunit D [Longibacter salinarum]